MNKLVITSSWFFLTLLTLVTVDGYHRELGQGQTEVLDNSALKQWLLKQWVARLSNLNDQQVHEEGEDLTGDLNDTPFYSEQYFIYADDETDDVTATIPDDMLQYAGDVVPVELVENVDSNPLSSVRRSTSDEVPSAGIFIPSRGRRHSIERKWLPLAAGDRGRMSRDRRQPEDTVSVAGPPFGRFPIMRGKRLVNTMSIARRDQSSAIFV